MSSKCIINDKNEILGFWEDGSKAPKEAVPCDKVHDIHGRGPMDDVKYLYKLVDGKVEDNS